jgi:Mg2+ and Co2+ transporter CorA
MCLYRLVDQIAEQYRSVVDRFEGSIDRLEDTVETAASSQSFNLVEFDVEVVWSPYGLEFAGHDEIENLAGVDTDDVCGVRPADEGCGSDHGAERMRSRSAKADLGVGQRTRRQ